MGTERPAQRADAGRDAKVAGHDLVDITINNYGRDAEEDFRLPFLVVDAEFLGEERKKPRAPYIARPPLWADVVHGQNAEARFLEREQFSALLSSIDTELLGPLRNGSDRRLRTLFVTGAPGCGKSTLVRHAAATLVERGDVIVADLGINHGRLIADDLESYLRGLSQLAAGGTPVLLLMDDPFFANSGWDLLLETLARPNYSGVAVLGATPTYLYETYGRPLSGRQVVLKTFALGATTGNERQLLAQMYGVRNDPDIDRAIGRHEDLLVFAMETASGSSFNEIIERIWTTLNDGRAIGPKSATADVEWPVLAFLLTSYLNRHYVMCPESLLRAFLVDLAGSAKTDFVHELSELTLGEGWHIFRVSPADSGSTRVLIGTMHARVAERAWEVRPFKAMDQVGLLARASAEAPECAAQLAEFMLACQSLKDPAGRGLGLKISEHWRDERISTAQLSALVRGLRASPAAMSFRGPLRERLRRRDSQSWLAAADLIQLERRGSGERDRLNQVELPYLLTIGDLSADSSAAIDLLGRHGRRQRGFADALCASLRGELGWQLDGKLLTWLLRNHRAPEVHSLLPLIYDWLEAHQDEERARVALVEWHTRNASRLEPGETDDLLDRVREWVSLLPDSRIVVAAFFSLASALLQAGGSLSEGIVEEMSSWVTLWPDDSYIRERYLGLLAQHYAQAPAAAADAVTDALDWLAIDPGAGDIRRALLGLVLADPAHPHAAHAVGEAFRWLCQHPSDSRLREVWVQLVQALPGSTVSQVALEALDWLGDHQDELGARLALQVLARALSGRPDTAAIIGGVREWLGAHADDGSVRAGFLGLVRELPQAPLVAEIITEARGWVLGHPGDARVRGALVALARARPEHMDAGEVIGQMIDWLADRPDDVEGHVTLLRTARGVPDRPEAARAVEQVVRWLDGQRGDNETWVALFSLVRAVPGHPCAAEACTAARQWLAQHPEDSHVRTGLLGFIRTMPGYPQTDEVIGETLQWLDQNPDDVNVRFGVSRLARDVGGSSAVREHLARARAWVLDRPDDAAARERVISLARDLADSAEKAEVITESREWLGTYPDSAAVWTALFGLARTTPQYPDAAGIVAEARRWLAAHPGDSHVRTGLLGYIRGLPGKPGAAEVTAETVEWLAGHGENDQVRAGLLALQRSGEAAAMQVRPAAPMGIAEARVYLAEHPEDRNVRVRLITMVRAATPALVSEVVAETRQWLEDHPEDWYTYHAFLVLLRHNPWHPDVPEVIALTYRWVDEHPDDVHVHRDFILLLTTRPDDPHAVAAIASAVTWLGRHPEHMLTRAELLTLIARHADHPHAAEAVAQARDWLEDNCYRAGNPHVRRTARSLLALIRVLPENLRAGGDIGRALRWLDGQYGDSLRPVGKRGRRYLRLVPAPEQPNQEELSRARARLDEHPDDAEARVRVLSLTSEIAGRPGAAEAVAETRRWLAAHPGEASVRGALFRLSLLLPGDPLAAEVVLETFRWLTSHPPDPRLQASRFYAALQEVPDHPKIPELIDAMRRWLAENPEARPFRRSLFRIARLRPESPVAADIVLEGRLWLLDHDDDVASRASLLTLVRAMPGYPEAIEVVRETLSWLTSYPDATTVRASLLGLARMMPDEPETLQLARETHEWLSGHDGTVQARTALLGLVRAVPGQPEALQIVTQVHEWLSRHPQSSEVREALLAAVRTLPADPPLVDELLGETREWLAENPGRPHRFNVLLRLLDLARRRPDSPVTQDLIAETRAWLETARDHPQYSKVLAGLNGLAPDLIEGAAADRAQTK